MDAETLTVSDLFCGAGGFSEGFRQMGYRVIFGLDNWQPAVDTFQFNHKHSETIKKSILDIANNQIDSVIPDSDVIVGSPPCTFFSKSNKAGKGDAKKGMELVLKFLAVVAVKKPRYWILENVPELRNHLKDSYSFKELGLGDSHESALKIPTIAILNAADYGVAQRRLRLFCGNFQVPEGVQIPRPISDIINALPDSTIKKADGYVIDPNYGFRIPLEKLSDHRYDTTLSRFEWAEAKRLKQDHSYYGRMSFPEDMVKPSRTIMATKSGVSREAMIFRSKKGCYRTPTVREAGCIQSYPITYQFIGKSEETKYRLVGNSVAPLLISRLAERILEIEGLKPNYLPNPHTGFAQPEFNLNGMERKKKSPAQKAISSRFRMHVPFLKIKNFRVDLDNLSSQFDANDLVWSSSLHHGTGKENAEKMVPTKRQVRGLLANYQDVERLKRFQEELEATLGPRLPDSMEFQKIYCNWVKPNGHFGPMQSLNLIKELLDRHFPAKAFKNSCLPNPYTKEIETEKIPIRIVAGLYACKYVEEKISQKGNRANFEAR
jgi:DNA (cytosine-5)-methyltransferase 1